MLMHFLPLWLLGLALLAGTAAGQVKIDVSGVGATQLPISVANFAAGSRAPVDLAAVIRSDLERSGAFRLIDSGLTLSESAAVDFGAVRGRGADTLLAGSFVRLADGRYDIRYRLYDAVRQTPLAGESLVAAEADLRLVAHRIADAVFEKLTGEKGVFSTRIAFVSKQANRYRLHVSDWDGENVQTPLVSPEPIISPTWSPDGSRLAYVSFEQRKPVVFVHALSSGQRTAVAAFKGSNSAPAWSPDGKTLAVSLTLNGLSQLYLIDAVEGSSPRRLTSSSGIDTEPAFSPDGRTLYFTSDRGGSPQIYRMPVSGGEPVRVTFSAGYNVSPRVSPDGRWLAFLTRRDGRYLVAVKDLVANGAETPLSEGSQDESPSFAPNSRWVLYANQQAGRTTLMATSVEGRVRQRLSSLGGDVREPAWGPYSR